MANGNNAVDWELSKENIQPLPQGRKMAQLRVGLQNDTEKQPTVLEQKQNFEYQLKSYTGDDILEVYAAYIEFMEQVHPKGAKDILSLIENCIKECQEKDMYKNSTKFYHIWKKCVVKFNDQVEFYKYYHEKNHFTELAEFYCDWAWEYEKMGNYKKAHSILEEGSQRRAQPFSVLHEKTNQFLSRMVDVKPDTESCSGAATVDERQRHALGALPAHGKKKTKAPVVRSDARPTGAIGIPAGCSEANLQDTPAFKIFTQEEPLNNSAPSGGSLPPIPLHGERSKENFRSPGKWNRAKMSQKLRSAVPIEANSNPPPKPEFGVHQDAIEQPAMTPRTIARSTHGPLSETKGPRPVSLSTEKEDPVIRVMYNKELLNRGTTECQFEEVHAAHWLKKRREEHQRKKEIEETTQGMLKQIVSKYEADKQQMLEEHRKILAEEQRRFFEEQRRLVQEDRQKQQAGLLDNIVQQLTDMFPNIVAFANGQGTKQQFVEEALAVQNDSNRTRTLQQMMTTLSETMHGNCPDGASGMSSLNSTHQPSPTAQTKAMLNTLNAVANKKLPLANMASTSSSSMVPSSADSTLRDENDEPMEIGELCALTPAPVPPESFPIYADEDYKCDLDSEDKENSKPADYIQPEPRRALAGILVPSKDIHYIPLEEQEAAAAAEEDDEDEEENDLEGIMPFPDNQNEDFTFMPPRNSTAFAENAKVMSTPRPQELSDRTPQNIVCLQKPRLSGETLRDVSVTEVTNWKTKTALSFIQEASREISGSSGSSSHSKADVTQTGLFHPPYLTQSCDDIDPFDIEIRDLALEHFKAEPGFMDNVRLIPSKMPTIRVGNNIVSLDTDNYNVVSKVGTGAYATVYRSESSNLNKTLPGKLTALKVEFPACLWEYMVSWEMHKRLKLLQDPVDKFCGVVKLDEAYIYENGSVLACECSVHGNLLDVINKYKAQIDGKTMPEILVIYFTAELLHVLDQLRRCHMIHADVKPDNVLLHSIPKNYKNKEEFFNKESCLLLIDLGRSIDMDVFPAGTTFQNKISTEDFTTTEMQDGRPWTYQVDAYGLAATVYCMLYGEYMKPIKTNGVWKLSNKLKRNWNIRLWEKFFHEMLNIPSCEQLPDMRQWCDEFKASFFTHKDNKTFGTQFMKLQRLVRLR